MTYSQDIIIPGANRDIGGTDYFIMERTRNIIIGEIDTDENYFSFLRYKKDILLNMQLRFLTVERNKRRDVFVPPLGITFTEGAQHSGYGCHYGRYYGRQL